MTTLSDAVPLPTERPPGCPFDPPAELSRLCVESPLSRMEFPGGTLGWLVTSRDLARFVLADARFSSRHELLPSLPRMSSGEKPPPVPPGLFIGMDPPEHTRYRRLLTREFTVRRMRQLAERMDAIAADHLDAMERAGPPADLVTAYAGPIPALMICELLGVHPDRRDRFVAHASVLNGLDATEDEREVAIGGVQEIMGELVAERRARPTDDLMSAMCAHDLTDDELAVIASLLLGAGLVTTSSMLALGTFALLRNPAQLAAWRADTDLADQAVEELLRYLSISPDAVRVAVEDVEVGGVLVRAGEPVTVSIHAANRDGRQFPDPDRLDLHRKVAGHVAFGHGVHQCLGQQLARVELRAGFGALLRRFPTLRLAVPPEDVPLRVDTQVFGLRALPVTWDAP